MKSSLKLNNPKPLIIVGIFLILLIFLLYTPPFFYINMTPSEPVGLYFRLPFDHQYHINDLVLLEVPQKVEKYVYGRQWMPKGWLLLKEVGALAGDKYCVTDDAIYINNRYIGPVFETDRAQKPLPKLRGSFQVSQGNFLPIATYIPTSFDGRYFGEVPLGLIKGKVIPIITF